MNSELVKLLVELVIGSAVVMAVIAFMCIITPRIAKLIIKKRPQLAENPERVNNDNASDVHSVKGPYDAQDENYDLNYKIYNKDIYGVDFKHGKEKRKNG
ncbi:MAG: hypothetical protein Q4D35_02200 [Ruminococcus sp.]|nr:hypothetical protein [Ruminococcus sp.]